MGLRLRLTLGVAAIFTVAFVGLALLALDQMGRSLRGDTRETAEQLLTEYLDGIDRPLSAEVAPADSTRFFYLDPDGNELTEPEFFEAVFPDDIFFQSDLLVEEFVFDVCFASGPLELTSTAGDESPLERCEEIDRLREAEAALMEEPVDLTSVEISTAFPGALETRVLDQGEDVVAVAQTVQTTDGRDLQVGVSTPLRPVDDSLRALRQLLLLAVPLLVAVVAAITWVVTGRALRSVAAITRQVEAIDDATIGERVSVPEPSDELRHLAVTMNRMLDRLDRSRRQQRQFVSDASHELRSPIAVSQTQLEVALAAPDDTDWAATANTVLAEQESLSQLVDDLLALGRLDETTLLAKAEVDLDDLVMAEADRATRSTLNVRVGQPARVTGDRRMLERAIRNLVNNADRHARSTVEVSLDVVDGEAVVVVGDDGHGIPVEDRERIFDRFTRLDEARDRARGGTGLGLAIVAEVVKVHGGTVTVDRGPLGGARFRIALPVSSV